MRVAGVLFGVLLGLTPARAGQAAVSGQAQGVIRLDVSIGKSQVIELKDPFTRASVTNPNVADVFAITPTQLLINGKAVGVTSLVVFSPSATLFFDLVVQIDTALVLERIKEVAPRDEVQVTPAQDAIIVSGRVSSEQMVAGVLEVASLFAPKGRVVNLLSVTDIKPQQVLLQVQVAEVERRALRELGFTIRALGRTIQAGMFPGSGFATMGGSLGAVSSSPSPVGRGTVDTGGPDFLFSAADFFISSGRRDYAGIVRALTERNLARTLAKPNLVTQSGREAKFLSGGEFPIPVAQNLGQVTIEFKEFGIVLTFTPIVLGETISLKVRPEVSSLDFTQGLELSGFRIPAILKNETSTTINLKDGESFAIAGLIKNEVRQAVQKIPVLGDIPVLGALFRSTRFRHNETELLFLVTVKLIQASPPGSAAVPQPSKLLELLPEEKKDFTLVPGIPGVGEVVERPLGTGILHGK